MNKELIPQTQSQKVISEIDHTRKMCQKLFELPHYKKMGAEGIFAIVEKAKSIGVNPLDALNGGMYFQSHSGKVELSSAMMNHLIRAAKHSITKDKRSDETICILHGKRADNGDTWVESFSIEDAKQAGIFKNQWLKYPKDMLFARALSRLARQLFPDVIKGCYSEGELQELESTPANDKEIFEEAEVIQDIINEDEATDLDHLIGEDTDYRSVVMNFLQKQFKVANLVGMPRTVYEKILPIATQKYEDRKNEAMNILHGEQHQMALGG